MKIIALAVLLAAMQTSPPVPRQATDGGIQPADTVKREPHKDKNPPSSATSVKNSACSPSDSDGTSNENAKHHNEQSVAITKLPAVSVHRDWADWIAWLLTIALAGVGVAGVIAAFRTLKKIGDQTSVAKDAFIASNRPCLTIKHVSIIPDRDIPGSPNKDLEWKFSCIVANVGGSKASIVESSLTAQLEGVGTLEGLLPDMPPYGKKYSFASFTIEPGERQERVIKLDANDESMKLRQAHRIAKIRRLQGDLPKLTTAPKVFFGFFRYKDDRGVARLTGFGCVWDAEDLSCARLNNPSYDYED